MRRLSLACAAVALLVPVSTADAARVLVLDDRGHVRVENDPFVPATPLPVTARAAQGPGAAPAPAPPPPGQPTPPAPPPPPPDSVRIVLANMLRSGQINQATHDAKLAIWNDAILTRTKITGERRAGLNNAIGLVGWMASHGRFEPSRLNLIFLQLERNTFWWFRADRIPGSGERVRIGDSRVLFQRVPGQALVFHPLANWGRAQSLFHYGYTSQGISMVSELLHIGSRRGPALTWEYLFFFGGGQPPWTSGLSQGTALVALSSAYRRTHNPTYANAIRDALRLYDLPTPVGVRVPTRWGNHYAEYSFAPRFRIFNGFVQALNGLWDAWHVLGDGHAAALFRAGDAEARHALSYYDTGKWSRYDNRGRLSGLHYHLLLRDFLGELCKRSRLAPYCAKAARFSYYVRKYGGPPRGSRTV